MTEQRLEFPLMKTNWTMVALVLSLTALGCDAATEVDESVDCSDLCNRYQSCYDTNYDVAACRDRCEGLVDADGGRPRAANDCDTCLDDRSCVSSAFTCNTECAGLIP